MIIFKKLRLYETKQELRTHLYTGIKKIMVL